MKFVKYGIIGCGGAWAFHSAGCKNNPKIKFNSVYDINEKAAKRTARIHKMQYYSDIEGFLKSDIDAVIIMVPHFLHDEMVIAAAEAGKHVLCEKPMATTLEGCDLMIDATKKAGVKFMIAENHRFLPAHKYIMETIQSGLIGDIFLIRSYEGVNEIPGLMREGFWKGHPIKAGGGALMDMGAHKFATMNWILNDNVESAYAWITKQCTNLPEKAEDNAMVHLQYKKGTIAEIIVSFSVISPPTNSLEIYGTKGSIIENHERIKPVKFFSKHEKMGENRGKWYEPDIEHGPFPIYYEISARLEDDHFTDCIINDKEPEFTPKQAKEAIFNVLLSYLSAKEERTVSRKDLDKIYTTIGTQTILEGLEKAVCDNCVY
ncbi:MAG: Gfo/Idh/MocA family oxidoreductase [Candidatus Lokiarchaeota archaeon]|nr:Gfo/Idh/MocA family oxidoreductase [Candidatus Lokiarchaeota archaeon]